MYRPIDHRTEMELHNMSEKEMNEIANEDNILNTLRVKYKKIKWSTKTVNHDVIESFGKGFILRGELNGTTKDLFIPSSQLNKTIWGDVIAKELQK